MKFYFSFLFLLLFLSQGFAQTAGDYRSAQSGDWESASTWQVYNGSAWQAAAFSPTINDGAVAILSGHTVTITSSFSADGLTVHSGGALVISGGNTLLIADSLAGTNLAVYGSLTANGKLVLEGDGLLSGTLTGSDSVIVSSGATFDWQAGNMTGAGVTYVHPGAVLLASSVSTKLFSQRSIIVSGKLQWTNGTFYGEASSLLSIQSGAEFEMTFDGTLAWTGNSTTWTLQNNGTIRKNTTAGATTFISFTFINNGTVDIQTGQLNLHSGGTYNSGSTFTGSGITYFISGTFEMNGTINTENLIWWGGAFTGTHTIVGTLSWYDGAFTGNTTDTTTIAEGSTFKIPSSTTKFISYRTVYNQGTIDWTSTSTLYFSYSPKIVNAATGTVAIKNDQYLSWSGAGSRGTIDNFGTIRKSTGTGITTISETQVNNYGTIDVQSGQLYFAGQNNGISTGAFNVASGSTISFNDGAYTWNAGTAITGAGTMQISGGTVSVTDTNGLAIDQQTTFSLASGTLTGNGILKIRGQMNWSGGVQSGTGRTQIDSSATVTVLGGSPKTLSLRTMRNYGTLQWLGTGPFYGEASSTLENMPSGLMEIENDATLAWNGVSTTWVFNNYGTIRKQTATGTTTFSSFAFINNGTVDIQTGQLNLQSGGTFNSSSTFTGAGLTYFVSGTFEMNGTISTENLIWWGGAFTGTHTIVGTLSWYDGSFTGNTTDTTTIAEGSTFKIPGSTAVFLSYRTLNNKGTIEWSGTGLWYLNYSSTVINSATGVLKALSNSNFEWAGSGSRGTMLNYGTIQKSIGTGTTYFGENYITNYGTIEAKTGLLSFNRLTNVIGSSLVGGRYDISASLRINDISIDSNKADIIMNGSASSLQNWSGGNALANFTVNSLSGTFTLRNGKQFTPPSAFVNLGVLVINDSSVFNSPGNYTQSSGRTNIGGGTLTASPDVDIQNGLLSGTGTVNGTLINGDSVSIGNSPGILNINGDYVQLPSSDILFEIGGHTAGSQYDRLVVNGIATLGGSTTTSLINGFVPLQGDTFALITANGRSGVFDFYYGLAIDTGRSFDPGYDSTRFYMVTFDLGLPHLVAPLNGEEHLNRTLFHDWNILPSANKYRFQLSSDSTFSTYVYDDTVFENRFKAVNLDYYTTYYWRVQGLGTFVGTGWSEIWSYTTIIEAPTAPTPITPAHHATNQSVTPQFVWQAGLRAAHYTLQISTDSSFTTNLLADSLAITDTSFTAPTLEYLTTYFWRIRSVNVGGLSSWSAVRKFTTIIEAPSQPALTSPSDSAINQPLTVALSWQHADRANSYRVQVSLSVGFASTIFDSVLSSTEYSVSGLTNLTRYYWRVSAQNDGGSSFWSAVRNFMTIIAPPSAPVLISPAHDTTLTELSADFRWLPAERAEQYYLEVAEDSLFTAALYADTLDTTVVTLVLPSFGTTYFWHVKSLNEGGASEFSQAGSFGTVEFYAQYGYRWNMVSLPLQSAHLLATQIFPDAVSLAFKYNGESGYQAQDTLSFNKGYWLKFPSPTLVTFSGTALECDTVEIVQGWNLIGGISYPIAVASVLEEPAELLQSPFWGYDGNYLTVDTLSAGKAYWVLANEPGMLILDKHSTRTAKLSNKQQTKATVTLSVRDASGIIHKLSIAGEYLEQQERMPLPPSPPAGIFDVRFSSGNSIECPEMNNDKSLRLILASAEFPVTISWEGVAGTTPATLKAGNTTYSFSKNGYVTLHDEETSVNVIIKSAHTQTLPNSYVMRQNYPNPFNPTTHISYELPFESNVTITLYSTLGAEVTTLVNGIQEAGYQSVEFNASELPSGMYFYKITATPVEGEARTQFTDTKKMILLK